MVIVSVEARYSIKILVYLPAVCLQFLATNSLLELFSRVDEVKHWVRVYLLLASTLSKTKPHAFLMRTNFMRTPRLRFA